MGLFSPRPEEPTEWPGLPGEPLTPPSAAERLTEPPADIGLVGLLGEGIVVESIVIPVEPVDEKPEEVESNPDDDTPAD